MVKGRIASIAEMVIKGETAADIGTDHAGLAMYMLDAGIAPRMIISDLPAGPFNRACLAVKNSPYRDRIEVRQGNGLQVLRAGEVFNVIIAGMGGDTIAEIINFDLYKARSFKHYVFQPMSKPQVLRSLLSKLGWPILDEVLVKEKKHYFVIISARPDNKPYSLSPLEAEIGPIILKHSSQPLVKEYLHVHFNKYQKLIAGLELADSPTDSVLKSQIKNKIIRLGAMIHEN